MKNSYLLFLFCWLLISPLRTVAQKVTFNNINMPTNSDVIWITDLKQDKQGYVWMTSFTGLHRYNGYEWSSFFHNPKDINGEDNSIESVCPTRDGLVWVGTQGLGLDCLDPETGTTRHYFLANRQKRNMTDNFISVLYEGRDGTLWVGTYNGLYSRSPKTGRFTHYASNPQDPQSLSFNQVRSICEDRSGAIWVGTGEPTTATKEEGGLNKLDRRTGRFTQYRHDPKNPNSLIDNRVRAILEDSRGTLWVGTWGDGLHTMDQKTGKFTRHPYNPVHPEQLSRPYLKNHKEEANWGISYIKEDATGNIWIGAYAGGLNRYDPKTALVTHYDAGQGGVENNQWVMCTSPDGVLWFGSTTGKVMKGTPATESIPFYGTTATLGINAFYEHTIGKLWLGTYAGLKNQTFSTSGEELFFKQATRQTTLLTDRIQTVYGDRQGKLWISTLNAGLYSYDPANGQFRNYGRDSVQNDKLVMTTYIGGALQTVISRLKNANTALATYEDKKGAFWILSSKGMEQLNRQTGLVTHYRHKPGDSTSISPGIGICALEDHTGQFWAGTSEGLNRMNRQTGTFTHYLTGNYIAQIQEDASGVLWVVTPQDNLLRFDPRQNAFRPFIDPNTGTPLINVDSFVEDNAQNLWVGTVVGIVRINRQRDSLSLFGPNYGFRGYSSISLASSFKSRDGTLIFGGENGYYRFHPDQLMAMRPTPPRLLVTGLLMANQAVVPNADGPLHEPIGQIKTLSLAHDQNTFAFDFVGIDHRHTEQIQYVYFLENYEPTWRSASSERRGSYYNMPPGKYIFRVKAGNNEAGWTEKSIAVIISPPWWRTWWAYVLFAILAAGAIWGFIDYRSRALRRENRLLEEKVTLRTEQLQKSLDDLKTTQTQLIQSEKMASLGELTAGIAHEIQNPLNFVNNFSEVSAEMVEELQQEAQKPQPDSDLQDELLGDLKQNLEKIAQHGSRASAIVKGMLEHARPSTGQREPTDLSTLADEYLRLAYHGFRSKNRTFNCELITDFASDLPKPTLIAQDIGRVLLNLYNNAFYAVGQRPAGLEYGDDYQPTVWVSTRLVNNGVELRVKDNGTGIPPEVLSKVFQPFFTTKPTGEGTGLGLSLSYDIITKGHSGTLTVSSQEGEGTTFILILPTTTII